MIYVKVLIVDTSGKDGVALGGAARVAGNLFHELRKRGISTYYLGYRNELIGKNRNTFVMEGGGAQATARRMAKGGALRSLSESRFARIAYYSTHSIMGVGLGNAPSWLEEVRPDIVISSSIQDYVTLKRMKRNLHGAKLVYIEHANASGKYEGALDYNILGLTFGTGRYVGLESARKRFFSFFDAVVALNKEQYRNVLRYNRDVAVIHSSANIEIKRPMKAQMANARKNAGASAKDGIVLYLGRLQDAQKNVSTLILAFKAIRSDRLRLLIVGNGKSASLYEGMAEGDNRIRVISGKITDSEVTAYYSIADLYVLPSIWESFNATFIEAAHFDAGLLLSAKSINEDIRERFGKQLYTFDPSNANELRKKIERYFSDTALRGKLKKLSKEIAQEYSRKRQMDAYSSALETLYKTGRLTGHSTV